MTLERRAALDLGTNSFLLTIADVEDHAIQRVFAEEIELVRLGQGLSESGCLHPDAEERALRALHRFARICRIWGIEPRHARAAGTSAIREASNSAEFLMHVQQDTGFRVVPIAGILEGLLTWRGGLGGLDLPEDSSPCLIDIGGGSTEIVWQDSQKAVSLSLGVVRGRETFVRSDPPSDRDLQALRAHVFRLWDGLPETPSGRPLVAVAGTPTTLAAIALGLPHAGTQEIHGFRLTIREIQRQINLFSSLPLADRQAIPGLHPQRADVIAVGAQILLALLERFRSSEILVSLRGLRYGLLMLPSPQWPPFLSLPPTPLVGSER